ncbi:MAG TPA: hypothetical protein VGF23_11475, partial [Gaiellaceae bacterium]
MRVRAALATLALAALAAAVTAGASVATPDRTTTSAKDCSFTLRIGDVLPFTGDLAAYGANLDKAVKLAVNVQNAALKKLGLSSKIKVRLIDSQDGQ